MVVKVIFQKYLSIVLLSCLKPLWLPIACKIESEQLIMESMVVLYLYPQLCCFIVSMPSMPLIGILSLFNLGTGEVLFILQTSCQHTSLLGLLF